jgi:hypothetical protein
VDDRFPPLQSSLVVGKAPPEFSKVTGWLRPSQLRASSSRAGWTVFRTPMASDIQQGILLEKQENKILFLLELLVINLKC